MKPIHNSRQSIRAARRADKARNKVRTALRKYARALEDAGKPGEAQRVRAVRDDLFPLSRVGYTIKIPTVKERYADGGKV